MAKASRTDIIDVLHTHAADLTESVTEAWTASAPHRAEHEFKRTHRCIVHDQIVRALRRRFDGKPGVYMYEKHETAYLVLDGVVVVRVKHGDRNGLGKNNHTQSSFAFVKADADPSELPLGLPDVQRVDVTYLLNPFETKIEAIMATARDGDTVLWSEPLYPAAAAPVEMLPAALARDTDPADVLKVPAGKREKKAE